MKNQWYITIRFSLFAIRYSLKVVRDPNEHTLRPRE